MTMGVAQNSMGRQSMSDCLSADLHTSDATSAGPWFFVKLPAGTYQIVATFEGKAVKRSVTAGKAKLQTVDFRWAAE